MGVLPNHLFWGRRGGTVALVTWSRAFRRRSRRARPPLPTSASALFSFPRVYGQNGAKLADHAEPDIFMKMRLLSLAALVSLIATANAQFTAGNLAVLRVGDGVQTLANTGNTIFIDQYTVSGTYVNSITIPDSGADSLILSGNATAEGYLSLSPAGQYLTFAAYNTARPYASSLSASAGTSVPRAVGMLDAAGTFSKPASITTSSTSWRSATTDGNDNYWGLASSGGTRYLGNTAAAATVQGTYGTVRAIDIFSGSLYFSSTGSTAPGQGIYVLSGLPTASATPSPFILTGVGSSPNEFVFNAAQTIAYVADDRAISSGGGVQRWDYDGSAWNLTYTLGTGSGSTVGARGLAVDFSGADPVIYATTGEASLVANRLISIVDTGAASPATLLATANALEVFRGLEFVPIAVPEPGSAVLLLLGLAALFRARKA
jgi:hypothetical protein